MTVALLRRFVLGVRPGRTEIPCQLRLPLAPAGFVVHAMTGPEVSYPSGPEEDQGPRDRMFCAIDLSHPAHVGNMYESISIQLAAPDAEQDRIERVNGGYETTIGGHPAYIAKEGAKYLVDCGVRTVGVDYLSVGGFYKDGIPTHHILLGAEVWIIEGLAGGKPPLRAQAIRGIALELERLACHTGDMGALADDVGFLPTFAYCGRLRGDWLNATARTPRAALRRTSAAASSGSQSGIRHSGIMRPFASPHHSSTIQSLYACTHNKPRFLSCPSDNACPQKRTHDGKHNDDSV